MKILQIDVAVNVGSTGRIAEEIGLKILENGSDSFIAYGRNARPSASETIKIGNCIDQAYHLLQTRLSDRHGLYSISATKEFVKKIEKLNPDIIHLHQLHGYYINIKILFDFLNSFKKPVIWTLHDCWSFTGHCCYFIRFNCEKWKTVCFKCPLKNYYPKSWLIDNSTNNFKLKKLLFNRIDNLTIVPVSNWLGNMAKGSFLKEQRIEVITNGVDLNIFKPCNSDELRVKHGLQNKHILLGVASLWSELKGLSDFYSLSLMIDSDTRIVLVGLNKKQINELPENIIGIERTENAHQLAEYYSMADVFINPSLAESFGLVTVEAMACATPSVAYNSTASPELITPGTGIVVEKNNLPGLSAGTSQLIKDGKEKYTLNCINRVKENFDKDKQYCKYIDLYNSLLLL